MSPVVIEIPGLQVQRVDLVRKVSDHVWSLAVRHQPAARVTECEFVAGPPLLQRFHFRKQPFIGGVY